MLDRMLMVDGRYDLLSEQLHLVGLLVFCVGGKLSPSGSSLLSRELKCVYRIFWTLSWLITKKKWKGSKVLIYLISTWSGCSCRMQDSLFPLGGPEHRERTVCWGGFGQSSSPSASSCHIVTSDKSLFRLTAIILKVTREFTFKPRIFRARGFSTFRNRGQS